MKYLMTGIVATAVVVGAVSAGSLVVSDRQIDKEVARLTDLAEQSGLEVVIARDDNQWLSRQLTLRISPQNADVQVPVIINNDIEQRPWHTSIEHEVLMDSDFSAPGLDPELQTLLSKNLVDRAFLTGHTQVGVRGNYKTQLSSVGISESAEDWSLEMSPLTLDLVGNVGGKLALQGEWPGMQAQSLNDAAVLTIAPVRFSAEGQRLASGLFQGAQSVTMDAVSLTADEGSEPFVWSAEDLVLTTDGRLVNERFASTMTVTMAQMNWTADENPLNVADLYLKSSVSGIEPGNYQRLMEELQSIQNTGVPGAALRSEASTLLKNGFEFRLDDWRAHINDQSLSLAAKVSVPENQLANVNVPISLLGLFPLISASAELSLDAALADIPQLYDPMMSLLMTGSLISDGDQYRMDASLNNGQVMLNGQPMPLPF